MSDLYPDYQPAYDQEAMDGAEEDVQDPDSGLMVQYPGKNLSSVEIGVIVVAAAIAIVTLCLLLSLIRR